MNHLQITGVAITWEENNTAAPAALGGGEMEGLHGINLWKQKPVHTRQKKIWFRVTPNPKWFFPSPFCQRVHFHSHLSHADDPDKREND